MKKIHEETKLHNRKMELDSREAALNERSEALETYTKARHKQLLRELELEESALRKKYQKLDGELSNREKNLPSDLIEKEKELERREKTIMEREALLLPRKERLKEREYDLDETQRGLEDWEKRLVDTAWKQEQEVTQEDEKRLTGNMTKILKEREAKLDDAQEKIDIKTTKLWQERKRLGIDKITSEELRAMQTKVHEKAEQSKAALNHAEDRLKELNDKKKEVDKLQKKLTRRLDAVEALMAGNVRQAIEEFV